MSVGNTISDIIAIIPKLGIVLGGIAFIVVMWFLGTSLEQSIPGAGASAGGVMAFIAVVIILYICLKYGKDWV